MKKGGIKGREKEFEGREASEYPIKIFGKIRKEKKEKKRTHEGK
jgi:hypothetical protein